jgi:hypothetical protein
MAQIDYRAEASAIARTDFRDVVKYDASCLATEHADTVAPEWSDEWCIALVSSYYERIDGYAN